MSEIILCPNCGKAMVEESKFKGLWCCPDYKVRLNNAPPFQFKCSGMILTDKGAEDFDAALQQAYAQQN